MEVVCYYVGIAATEEEQDIWGSREDFENGSVITRSGWNRRAENRQVFLLHTTTLARSPHGSPLLMLWIPSISAWKKQVPLLFQTTAWHHVVIAAPPVALSSVELHAVRTAVGGRTSRGARQKKGGGHCLVLGSTTRVQVFNRGPQ